jgi:hypothetical protein
MVTIESFLEGTIERQFSLKIHQILLNYCKSLQVLTHVYLCES